MQALNGAKRSRSSLSRANTTVHAPQSPSAHPSFVPFAPISSRSQSSTVVRGENCRSSTSPPRKRKRSAFRAGGMASNDMIAPNPSKMELLWAKRKDANSVPEAAPPFPACSSVGEAPGGQNPREARKRQKPNKGFG